MSAGAPGSTGLGEAASSGEAQSSSRRNGASSGSGPTSGFPRIDKYELLEEIGHGGMATVYRARDPRLGREVAVKVIHKHLRENPEVGTRFVAEARAAAKLRHPGIVDVYDVSGDDDGERYLVVELIRGTTLRRVLQKHRDMPAEVGASIVVQICDALQHAHTSAIIHRDIKPENVLVELPADRAAASERERATPKPGAVLLDPDLPTEPSAGVSGVRKERRDAPISSPSDTVRSLDDLVQPRGVHGHHAKAEARVKEPVSAPDHGHVIIKITDFGIAKILDAAGVTSTGQVLGSPAHMAPEQIEGGEVDARTDVFALGVLMYECLVGHLPFEGKNPAQVLRRVLDGTYPAADRERPEVGGRWSRLVAQALARDPAERTPSAAALGDAIRRELSVLGIADPKQEVEAYFADPEGHAAALRERLVPCILARGEAARRAGDIPGAAADFNRALALRPDDLTILRRLGSLTSSAGRRLLVRRAAAIAGGSVVLGLLAFGGARAWKSGRSEARPPASASSTIAEIAPPLSDKPTATVERVITPVVSAAVPIDSAKRPRVPASPGFTPAPPPPPPPAPGARKVSFVINVKGAKLTVDGAAQTWPYVMTLPTGSHQVEVTPNVARCCKKLTTTVQVEAPPGGDASAAQQIPLTLEIEPAKVTLLNAPQNGQLSCPELSLTCFAGGQKQVKLREPAWNGSCSFSAPDKPSRKGRVTINAGELNAVSWPAD